ncbi:MAG: helix-turn-helix domain-containing protein [Pseudomonadota bacterium]
MPKSRTDQPSHRDNQRGEDDAEDRASPGRRGRPLGFDRDAALQIALRLFRLHGYDGVGIAELTDAMGIRAPSLYAAFGNKQGLYEAAVAAYVAQNATWMSAALDNAPSIADGVRTLLRHAAVGYANGAGPGAVDAELCGCDRVPVSDDEPRGCMVLNSTRTARDEDVRAVTFGPRNAVRVFLRQRMEAVDAARADELADYVAMALHGLSAMAADSVSLARLKACAEAAADGFENLVKKGE